MSGLLPIADVVAKNREHLLGQQLQLEQQQFERLKHDYVAPQRSSMQNLSETFGKPFSLLWLLPTAVKFHGLTYRDLLAEEMLADMECSPCV